MSTLWGTKGRPETEAYADRCAEQIVRRHDAKVSSPVVREVIKPREAAPAPQIPRRAESRRTKDKWAAARARHAQ